MIDDGRIGVFIQNFDQSSTGYQISLRTIFYENNNFLQASLWEFNNGNFENIYQVNFEAPDSNQWNSYSIKLNDNSVTFGINDNYTDLFSGQFQKSTSSYSNSGYVLADFLDTSVAAEDVKFSLDNIVANSELSSLPSIKPTVEQLALFSLAAYTGKFSVAGYSNIDLSSADSGLIEAVAGVSLNNEYVVLSFKGTDFSNIEDLKADASFLTPSGAATSEFKEYTYSAASILKYVYEMYPDADIILTGHSLGGAIAQVLGDVSGISAVSFNAPGPGQALEYFDFANKIESIVGNICSDTNNEIINYRIYGDIVSTLGNQVGNTVTFQSSIPKYLVDLFPIGTMKANHEMDVMFDRVFNNAPISNDFGPTYREVIEDGSIKIYAGKLFNPLFWLLSIANLGVFVTDILFIEPDYVDQYTFEAEIGSPNFRTVTMPYLYGFDATYDLEIFLESWISVGLFNNLDTYDFGLSGAEKFRFTIYDTATMLSPDTIKPFTFGVTFASNGIFSGSVVGTLSNHNSVVPEPSTIMLFATGLLGLLGVARINRQ